MPLELLRPGLAIVLAFFSSSTDGSCCLESSSTVGGLQWELWGGGAASFKPNVPPPAVQP